MKCPNCKKEIKDTAKFCGYCGSKIKKITEPKVIENKGGCFLFLFIFLALLATIIIAIIN